MQAALDVASIDTARAAMLGVVEDFRAGAIDADTVERAKRPLLEDYRNALKTLSGWMNLVRRIQSEPERVGRWLAVPERLERIGAQEIGATAERWLDPVGALEIVVLPKHDCAPDAAC